MNNTPLSCCVIRNFFRHSAKIVSFYLASTSLCFACSQLSKQPHKMHCLVLMYLLRPTGQSNWTAVNPTGPCQRAPLASSDAKCKKMAGVSVQNGFPESNCLPGTQTPTLWTLTQTGPKLKPTSGILIRGQRFARSSLPCVSDPDSHEHGFSSWWRCLQNMLYSEDLSYRLQRTKGATFPHIKPSALS